MPPAVRAPRRAGGPRARRGEAGYNLVILIMVLAVMNVLVAAALPAWSTAIRREKEEELLFRGLQYAEAIRLFRNRTGNLPNKLEQLIEVQPRCIRQLWKDPMTEDGKWTLIFQGQPLPLDDGPTGDQVPPDGQPPPGGQAGLPGPPSGFGSAGNGEVVAVGPIIGVRSRSSEKSILRFTDPAGVVKERYDRWYFTVDLLTAGGVPAVPPGGGAAVPRPGMGLVLSTRWIGRPIRPEFAGTLGGLPPGIPPNNPGGLGGGLGGPRGPGQQQPPPRAPRNPARPPGQPQ